MAFASKIRRMISCAALLAAVPIASGSLAYASSGDTDPSVGDRSNLGLCSPYLAQLDPPVFAGDTLGGNARSGVNLLIKLIGPMLPDEIDSPGELYRIRAREHPADPASVECVPRPPVG